MGPHTAWPGEVAVGGFFVMSCTSPSTPEMTPATSTAILWVSTPKVEGPSVVQDNRAGGSETTGVIATQVASGSAARSSSTDPAVSSDAPHAAANRTTTWTWNDFMVSPFAAPIDASP